MLKVVIPQVLELQPALVYWQPGEAAKPKTIVAKAGKDISIKKLDVSSSTPDFVAKVEPGPAAGEFRINIEPKQTKQPAAATLTIKPELPNGKPKVFYATARVMPQSPVAGAATASAKVCRSKSRSEYSKDRRLLVAHQQGNRVRPGPTIAVAEIDWPEQRRPCCFTMLLCASYHKQFNQSHSDAKE